MRKIPAKHTAILYNTVREIKPRRTVLVTHAPRNTVEELKPYSREGDAIAVDIYPVPVGYMSDLRNKTMSCVGEYADKTLKSAVRRGSVSGKADNVDVRPAVSYVYTAQTAQKGSRVVKKGYVYGYFKPVGVIPSDYAGTRHTSGRYADHGVFARQLKDRS